MIDDLDPPADGDGSPTLTPRVMVRSRGVRRVSVLVPPVLILLAAVAVLWYRVHTPDWQGLVALRSRSTTPPVREVRLKPPAPLIRGPIRARIESPPEPLPPSESVAQEAPDLPPPIAEISKVVPEEAPAVALAPAGPVLPPEVDPVDVLDDIRREAARKRVEDARLLDAKQRAIERDRREASRRRTEQLARVRRDVEDDRSAFNIELAKVLRRFGDRAGPEIEALCNRHGRTMLPETRKKLGRAGAGPAARLANHDRIQLYRTIGLPEAVILDILVCQEARSVGSRSGPRNRHEARVRAARLLLASPLAAKDEPDRHRQARRSK